MKSPMLWALYAIAASLFAVPVFAQSQVPVRIECLSNTSSLDIVGENFCKSLEDAVSHSDRRPGAE